MTAELSFFSVFGVEDLVVEFVFLLVLFWLVEVEVVALCVGLDSALG